MMNDDDDDDDDEEEEEEEEEGIAIEQILAEKNKKNLSSL